MTRLVVAFWLLLWMALPLGAAELDAGADAYERGDYATAIKEWAPLALSGDSAAQYNLALLYHFGLGTAPDINQAVEWYSRAAEQGQPDAQVAIGDLFLAGLWGAPDPEEAAMWYQMAADQGHAEADRKLNELGAQGLPSRPNGTPTEGGLPLPPAGRPIQQAEGQDCPPFPDPGFRIDVRIEIPPAPVNHSYSKAELTQANFHGRRSKVLGLMVPDLNISASGNYEAVRYGDAYCFWVKGITVLLGYRSIEIFVASEYKPGSCPYRVILRHEQDHVRVARRNLNRYAPTVRGALTSLLIPKASAPVKIASPEAAEAEFQSLYKMLLEPVYKEMLTALQKAQALVDSPPEYRRTFKLCRNW